MPFKHALQNIISGTGSTAKENTIQAISHYIRKSKRAGTVAQKEEFIKEQEAALILDFAGSNIFFIRA
jgi:hypothetical protein